MTLAWLRLSCHQTDNPVRFCAWCESDVFSWPGPGQHLTQSSERTGIENNWFALTGRIVDVKVEMDGDLHVALQDATGYTAAYSHSVRLRAVSPVRGGA